MSRFLVFNGRLSDKRILAVRVARGIWNADYHSMLIAIILASWVGISVLFCIALAAAAARRSRQVDETVVKVIEVPTAREESFALEVIRPVAATA